MTVNMREGLKWKARMPMQSAADLEQKARPRCNRGHAQKTLCLPEKLKQQ